MRILFLYRYIKQYNFDHHLHMAFAQFMSEFPGIELKAYGPSIGENYPAISLMLYHPKYTLKDIHRVFPFDVILVCTKSRMFMNYNPHENKAEGGWLPNDFSAMTCPKIVLEEDYHYEKNDDWYHQVRIDLILQRHYSQSLRKDKVPMKFFPFSVDTNFFNHQKTSCNFNGSELSLPTSRQNKLGFIGNYLDQAYIYRKTVRNELVSKGIASAYNDDSGNVIENQFYVRALRSFVGYISCGSTFEICAAKNLEIMSCGGVLFTNKFKGIDLLFPENSYATYNTRDYSDVTPNALKVINEPAYAADLAKNALKCVYESHSHEVRTKDLLKIIKRL